MASDRSVDALWEEMQRETSGRRLTVDVSRLLSKSMASDKPSKRTAPKKREMKTTKDVVRLIESVELTEKLSLSGGERPRSTVESFSLTKELNRLADERPSVRKQAALALEAHLLIPTDQADALPDRSSFSDIAKPLFKRFNDSIEKVREVCIKLTTKYVATEEDLLRVLPYLMPAISNRINSQWSYDEANQVFTRDQFLHDAFKRGRVFVKEDEVTRLKPTEPSEEIRLLFLELLSTLLQNAFERNASSILHAYVFDILMILVSGVHDDFHDVNIKTCELLKVMCGHMVSVMKHFTIAFTRAAKELLIHRLARVRAAAIDCIQALVSCPNFEKCKGSGTEAIVDLIGHRDENVIPIAAFYTGEVRYNFFARLDQDASPQVRRAFYTLIQDWILNLPDRYDHESRLMPYLLSAVSNELDEISSRAIETLDILGKRYEQEHGEEVLEMKQYGVDGKNPSYNYVKRLPAPFFDKRPSLGTRLYVRGRTRRFLNPILRELENWQSPTRAQAVRLLKCVIVYSEETITVDAHVLLLTLLKTWDLEGAENRTHFHEIADLVGRFVAPKTYLPLLLARIRGDDDAVGSVVSPEAVGTALEVLHCVLGGSLEKLLLPLVQEIVDALGSTSVVGFETPRIKLAQAQLVLFITELLQRRGRDAVSAFFLENGRLTSLERVLERLFEMAVCLSTVRQLIVADKATASLAALQCMRGFAILSELFDSSFDACFTRAASHLQSLSDLQWASCNPDQVLIEQLLQHTSTAFLQANPQRVKIIQAHFQAMEAAASDDADVASSARAQHYRLLRQSLTKRLGEDVLPVSTLAPTEVQPIKPEANATAA